MRYVIYLSASQYAIWRRLAVGQRSQQWKSAIDQNQVPRVIVGSGGPYCHPVCLSIRDDEWIDTIQAARAHHCSRAAFLRACIESIRQQQEAES